MEFNSPGRIKIKMPAMSATSGEIAVTPTTPGTRACASAGLIARHTTAIAPTHAPSVRTPRPATRGTLPDPSRGTT